MPQFPFAALARSISDPRDRDRFSYAALQMVMGDPQGILRRFRIAPQA